MTDHGSIRAITRFARRGCPELAGRTLAVDDPRVNLTAPRCLPLRRAAPRPPAAAAVAPNLAPRPAASRSAASRPTAAVVSVAPNPVPVSAAVAADPTAAAAGEGTSAGAGWGAAGTR